MSKGKGTKRIGNSKDTKGKGKSKDTKGKGKSKGTKRTRNSTKTREKSEQDSGMLRGSAELGVKAGGRTLGKLEAGPEAGVKEEKQGSRKIGAGLNLAFRTDALDDIKEAAGDTFDNLKTGFKAAGKKLSQVYDSEKRKKNAKSKETKTAISLKRKKK